MARWLDSQSTAPEQSGASKSCSCCTVPGFMSRCTVDDPLRSNESPIEARGPARWTHPTAVLGRAQLWLTPWPLTSSFPATFANYALSRDICAELLQPYYQPTGIIYPLDLEPSALALGSLLGLGLYRCGLWLADCIYLTRSCYMLNSRMPKDLCSMYDVCSSPSAPHLLHTGSRVSSHVRIIPNRIIFLQFTTGHAEVGQSPKPEVVTIAHKHGSLHNLTRLGLEHGDTDSEGEPSSLLNAAYVPCDGGHRS